MMNFIYRIFKMSETEEAFQKILEESKDNGSLPRISRNGTLHVSATNVRKSKKAQRVLKQANSTN